MIISYQTLPPLKIKISKPLTRHLHPIHSRACQPAPQTKTSTLSGKKIQEATKGSSGARTRLPKHAGISSETLLSRTLVSPIAHARARLIRYQTDTSPTRTSLSLSIFPHERQMRFLRVSIFLGSTCAVARGYRAARSCLSFPFLWHSLGALSFSIRASEKESGSQNLHAWTPSHTWTRDLERWYTGLPRFWTFAGKVA